MSDRVSDRVKIVTPGGSELVSRSRFRYVVVGVVKDRASGREVRVFLDRRSDSRERAKGHAAFLNFAPTGDPQVQLGMVFDKEMGAFL